MDKINSIFDVLGPIMIGPSSSHTAGAARLGKIARYIANKDVKSVKFYLHGSFAETYKGHGTNRALTAGILGMEPHDENLRFSLVIAKREGIDIDFIKMNLGNVHPNTVKLEITSSNNSITSVTGSSLGGGAVVITEVNGFDVQITGKYYTLITKYNDKKGVISTVSSILSNNNINIASMRVKRKSRGLEASMIIESDDYISPTVLDEIRKLDIIDEVIKIEPVDI